MVKVWSLSIQKKNKRKTHEQFTWNELNGGKPLVSDAVWRIKYCNVKEKCREIYTCMTPLKMVEQYLIEKEEKRLKCLNFLSVDG